MNITLLAADVTKVWLSELVVFFIPSSIVGAGIGWIVGRWYPCLLLSYATAIALISSHRVAQHLHIRLGLTKQLGYSAVLILPPILIAASAGYFFARKFKTRRLISSC